MAACSMNSQCTDGSGFSLARQLASRSGPALRIRAVTMPTRRARSMRLLGLLAAREPRPRSAEIPSLRAKSLRPWPGALHALGTQLTRDGAVEAVAAHVRGDLHRRPRRRAHSRA